VDNWREDAAAYVLGSLSPEERTEFEVHLVGCAECAVEVGAFARVTAALAHAAPPLAPSARLRDRVVAAAQAFPPPPSGLKTSELDFGLADRLAGRPADSLAGAAPWQPRAVFAPWLLAAASLAMALGLGGYSVALRRAASDAKTVVVVLGASDLVRVELAGQPVAPRAAARAFWSRSRGLVFTASNLPPLASGRTYQLWIVTGQTPVGAGLLKPGADGIAHAVFATPSDLSTAVAMAVTIEPDGGVPAPTGDKYLVGLVN
jgi:anti-sigma-K factor RskA